MGARNTNARKKAKRRAHKRTPEELKAQAELYRQQSNQRQSVKGR